MTFTATVHTAQELPKVLERASAWCKPWSVAGHRMTVTVEEEVRTPEQNKAQWPILEAFSKQIKWPVNGEMVYMTPEEWKDVLTAAFKQETVRLAAGLDGGVVMLGQRTSKFKKSKWPQWMAFLNATAAMRGVRIPAPEWMEA